MLKILVKQRLERKLEAGNICRKREVSGQNGRVGISVGIPKTFFFVYFMHQSIPTAPSPLPGYSGAFSCPPCQSRGLGICRFCSVRGPGICQPRAFDTHAVSCQNTTAQRILLKKQADWLICKGRETVEEVCKGIFSILCMHFVIFIKPELHSGIGSYRRESTVIESNFF